MEILKTAKELLAVLGVIPLREQWLTNRLCKYKILINYLHIGFIFAIMISCFSSLLYFLLFATNEFAEYHECLVIVCYVLFTIVLYAILLWKRMEVMEFIDDMGKIILTSKYSFGCEKIRKTQNYPKTNRTNVLSKNFEFFGIFHFYD